MNENVSPVPLVSNLCLIAKYPLPMVVEARAAVGVAVAIGVAVVAVVVAAMSEVAVTGRGVAVPVLLRFVQSWIHSVKKLARFHFFLCFSC